MKCMLYVQDRYTLQTRVGTTTCDEQLTRPGAGSCTYTSMYVISTGNQEV